MSSKTNPVVKMEIPEVEKERRERLAETAVLIREAAKPSPRGNSVYRPERMTDAPSVRPEALRRLSSHR
jgi:hypothetical protein